MFEEHANKHIAYHRQELKYEQLLNGNIDEKVAVLKNLQENAEKRTNYLSIS